MSNGLLDNALRYAKLGWKIFPCLPGQKTPATKHGVKDATSDEDQIREWWTKTPNANIAVACGTPSGVYVVDVDVDKDKNVNGLETIKQLKQKGKVLPMTITQETPRGGVHCFYRTNDPPANKNSFLPGVDLRGTGYYVVLAPSVHPNGLRYKWSPNLSPWDRKPAEYPDFMRPSAADRPTPVRQLELPSPEPADANVLKRASLYLATCDPAVQGQGGHDRLLWAAYCLVHGFLLSDDQALNLLIHEYNVRCDPPWDLSDPKDCKDFTRKITEARKLQGKHPRGWLLEENVVSDANTEEFFARLKAKASGLPVNMQQTESYGDGQHTSEGWPEIVPLDRVPRALRFDPSFLPDDIRPWIEDIADRTQAPIDYPAVAAVVAVASLVGRQLTIRPKQYDDWAVVPNLWGNLVGRPALMKTPCLQAALAPLRRLEVEAKEKYLKELNEWEQKAVILKEQEKLRVKEIRDALKSGEGNPEKLLATSEEEVATNAPRRRRYLLNDSTTPKVGEILRDNPNGILQVRDELIGLLRGLDKPGREEDRAFYLESWNGDGRFTYDRIERGTIDIEALCISIIGCTQPGPWRRYVQEAVSGGVNADGLTQRFQLAVWPESSKEWRNVDRWPDSDARNRAYAVFESLHKLPHGIGEQGEFDDLPYVRFSPEAQERFNEWREALEHRLLSNSLHEVMESHLAKYRSLIPSLALVFSLADENDGDVPLTYLERAIRMGEYLESHARKLYASVAVSDDLKAAMTLLSRIEEGHLEDGFTTRDVYRKGWSGLKPRSEAEQAIATLKEHGYLRSRTVKTRGAPRIEHEVNPAVFSGRPLLTTDITDRSTASDKETPPVEAPSDSNGSVSSGSPQKTSPTPPATGGRHDHPEYPPGCTAS